MEEGAEIGPLAVLGGGGNIFLHKYSTINYGAKLIPGTFVTDGEYMNDAIPERSHQIVGSITIDEGAYIGSNAVICISKNNPNIKIGKFAVIGALSYIDKDVPAYKIIHPLQTFYRKDKTYTYRR
jgi:acetyltransferase-like isoleucine patch superfamily enzyme